MYIQKHKLVRFVTACYAGVQAGAGAGMLGCIMSTVTVTIFDRVAVGDTRCSCLQECLRILSTPLCRVWTMTP